MKTYLLTWNPKKWSWTPQKLKALRKAIDVEGFGVDSWSCGHNRNIRAEDRVFLLRQGREPRGIVGSGWVARGSFEGPSYTAEKAAQGATTWYVEVRFEVLLVDGEKNPFPRERLDAEPFAATNWNTQVSGITIDAASAAQLEQEWGQFLNEQNIAQGYTRPFIDVDASSPAVLVEGKKTQAFKNSYERNPRARALCLKHHGFSCSVCGFNFGSRYGVTGQGYIHVHHLKPLSEVGEEYQVDPTVDLRPVCANCHAMLHARTPPLSIEELQKLLQ